MSVQSKPLWSQSRLFTQWWWRQLLACQKQVKLSLDMYYCGAWPCYPAREICLYDEYVYSQLLYLPAWFYLSSCHVSLNQLEPSASNTLVIVADAHSIFVVQSSLGSQTPISIKVWWVLYWVLIPFQAATVLATSSVSKVTPALSFLGPYSCFIYILMPWMEACAKQTLSWHWEVSFALYLNQLCLTYSCSYLSFFVWEWPSPDSCWYDSSYLWRSDCIVGSKFGAQVMMP